MFKKFKDFAEEKSLGDKNGLVPNQDIPKAGKTPDLMKLKSDKPLGGHDYKGNMATNPIKGTDKDPLPYKGFDKVDQEKTGKGLLVNDDDEKALKTGFAFKGNKIQTPKNSAALGEEPDLKIQKIKSNKMTSEQFIEQTKNMKPAEFISFFVEGSEEASLPTVTDLYGNEFTPDPNQTIQYLASLMVKNPQLLSRFTREMKRHDNGMNLIMDEHFNHPEFYSVLAEGMAKPEEGRKRCHRLGRAMNDQYMEALEKYVMEQKINEEVQPKVDLVPEDGGPIGSAPQNPSGMTPPKMTRPQGGAFGGGGSGSGPQPAAPGGAFGGGGPSVSGPLPGGAFGGGGPGMGGNNAEEMPPGSGANPPAMPLTGMPPTGMPGGNASGGTPGLDMGTGGKVNTPMPKLKGESAHSNIIEELGSYPHIRSFMINHCTNPPCNK